MIYYHRFQVRASLEQVSEFHRRAGSMAAITPPPIIIRLKRAPAILREGDELDFMMWLGPFPLRWLARIEAVTTTGFTDRQLSGPFAEWVHRHTFVAVSEWVTDVVDEITLQPRSHLFWWFVGMGMRAGLPILFAYRAWKTRRMLQ